MSESTIDQFNIEPLVINIENLIKNGLKLILKDYINRYDLLEKTHKQIMKLPSVMNEINKCPDSDSDLEYDNDSSKFIDIRDMTRDLVKTEILHIENNLDRIEKKYEAMSPLICKILEKLESINDEVKLLKETSRDNNTVQLIEPVKSLIVSTCENENIKFEINEDVSDEDLSDEDVNEEDVNEEDVNEEDVNEEDANEKSEDRLVEVIEPVKVEKITVIKVEEVEEEEDEEEDEVEDEVEDEEEVEEEEEEVETEASEDEASEYDDVVVEVEKNETILENTKLEETEEEELTIITIDDIDYCTNDEDNGFIWDLSEEGEQGNKIGYLKEGEPFFYADEM
jgi:hypothetical protein